MSANVVIDYRNPDLVRRMGIKALTKELGPVGMVHFIQQFDRGEGNYTVEREALLSGFTMEDALHELKEIREREMIEGSI